MSFDINNFSRHSFASPVIGFTDYYAPLLALPRQYWYHYHHHWHWLSHFSFNRLRHFLYFELIDILLRLHYVSSLSDTFLSARLSSCLLPLRLIFADWSSVSFFAIITITGFQPLAWYADISPRCHAAFISSSPDNISRCYWCLFAFTAALTCWCSMPTPLIAGYSFGRRRHVSWYSLSLFFPRRRFTPRFISFQATPFFRGLPRRSLTVSWLRHRHWLSAAFAELIFRLRWCFSPPPTFHAAAADIRWLPPLPAAASFRHWCRRSSRHYFSATLSTLYFWPGLHCWWGLQATDDWLLFFTPARRPPYAFTYWLIWLRLLWLSHFRSLAKYFQYAMGQSAHA